MPPAIAAMHIFYLGPAIQDDGFAQMGLKENYILLGCGLEKNRAKAVAFVAAI
jgi:hypothetical protein